jgi:hypothetical protein
VEVRAADPGPRPEAEVRGRDLARELGIGYHQTYEELMGWGPDAVLVTSEYARHRPWKSSWPPSAQRGPAGLRVRPAGPRSWRV